MKGMLFSLHTNKIFWKREKMLAFFYLCSLTLLLSSILLYCGESVKKASFLFCIKGGAFGILCLSIGLGFFIVWLQSIEERKEDFFVLRRIGTSKSALILSVQLEMLLFQFIAGAMVLFLMLLFIFTIGEYQFGTLCMCLVRLHIELQGIALLITTFLIQKWRI